MKCLSKGKRWRTHRFSSFENRFRLLQSTSDGHSRVSSLAVLPLVPQRPWLTLCLPLYPLPCSTSNTFSTFCVCGFSFLSKWEMIYASWNLSHFGTKGLVLYFCLSFFKKFSVKTAGFPVIVGSENSRVRSAFCSLTAQHMLSSMCSQQ